MTKNDLMWTRRKLVSGIRNGKVAGVVALGCTVQFLIHPGDHRGYLARNDGAIRRFDSDEQGWRCVEAIKKTAT